MATFAIPKNPRKYVADDRFKSTFRAVLMLTVLCLSVSVFLTFRAESTTVRSLNETVLTCFKLGCGAILGLLGGKAAS